MTIIVAFYFLTFCYAAVINATGKSCKLDIKHLKKQSKYHAVYSGISLLVRS